MKRKYTHINNDDISVNGAHIHKNASVVNNNYPKTRQSQQYNNNNINYYCIQNNEKTRFTSKRITTNNVITTTTFVTANHFLKNDKNRGNTNIIGNNEYDKKQLSFQKEQKKKDMLALCTPYHHHHHFDNKYQFFDEVQLLREIFYQDRRLLPIYITVKILKNIKKIHVPEILSDNDDDNNNNNDHQQQLSSTSSLSLSLWNHCHRHTTKIKNSSSFSSGENEFQSRIILRDLPVKMYIGNNDSHSINVYGHIKATEVDARKSAAINALIFLKEQYNKFFPYFKSLFNSEKSDHLLNQYNIPT